MTFLWQCLSVIFFTAAIVITGLAIFALLETHWWNRPQKRMGRKR